MECIDETVIYFPEAKGAHGIRTRRIGLNELARQRSRDGDTTESHRPKDPIDSRSADIQSIKKSLGR